MKAPTLLDMFCGAGGISHGFMQAGFEIVGGCDLDEDALTTFEANHPGSRVLQVDLAEMSPQALSDALGIKPGSIDCIAGGPPCQGFSRNRAFRHQEGVFVDDPRNHLYWHFFNYVDYFRPNVVVMENVPEILIKADGFFREAVFKRFQSLGYSVDARVLNAAEFGVPQWRRRAIFLAGRGGKKVPFPMPTSRPGPRPGNRTPTSKNYSRSLYLFDEIDIPKGPTIWDAIGDLHGQYASELNGPSAYASEPFTDYQRERRGRAACARNHYPWPLTERQLQRIRLLREGQSQLHLPQKLQTKEGYGSAYRRMQSDAQALTITTWMFHPGSGMFTHPFDDRVVTIREAARLQSFQDDFVFYGRYHSQCRQVGNSVAPLVARSLASAILPVLGFGRHHASTFNPNTPSRTKNAMVSSRPARLQSM